MKRLTTTPAGAIILCLAGGILVFLTSGRVWARTTVSGVTNTQSLLSVTGHQTASSIPAVGIALMALALAILAASGVLRRMVGGVTVLVAIGAIGAAFYGRSHVSSALTERENQNSPAVGIALHATANGWWIVTLVGGLVALAAALLTVMRAPQWAAMSARYDAPNAAKPSKDPSTVAWDALDRGEDPTA